MDETEHKTTNITLIGAGTIGLSFAALHLNLNPRAHITIYDTRPDLETYVHSTLPSYLSTTSTTLTSASALRPSYTSRLTIARTLQEAVSNADIIQEQGPESQDWKVSTWRDIEAAAPARALFWSSTSGIPASVQSSKLKDPSRLLVVHPYNPPHIMPLLEIVPSPTTAPMIIDAAVDYWTALGRQPVVLKKECTGFVANRLAFALLREAVSLVEEGVIGVKELDDLVTSSMGPRWAVQGPFMSYHAGGGEDGLKGFMEKIGGTVQECWEEGEKVKVGPGGKGMAWVERVCGETERVYGMVDTGRTAGLTRSVLEVTRQRTERSSDDGDKKVEGMEQEDR